MCDETEMLPVQPCEQMEFHSDHGHESVKHIQLVMVSDINLKYACHSKLKLKKKNCKGNEFQLIVNKQSFDLIMDMNQYHT